jgi:NTE family protein
MARANRKTVNLALQGGGAHGAFTWGVLDALMEDGRIEVEGISGTSAGAMNGAAFALGFEEGGPDGARAKLEAFWRAISRSGAPYGSWLRLPAGTVDLLGGPGIWNVDWAPFYVGFDLATRLMSPYQTNPLNLNPLKDALTEVLPFERLRACHRTKLFVSATNVRTGKIRVFRTEEVTPDALLASACLPFIFRAVEIDGEAYWDGGYMGNPAIYPLIYHCDARDMVIVQINPIHREEVPTSARDIMNRVTEISWNATLMREMRAIAFVSKLVDEGRVDVGRYKKLRLHMVEAEKAIALLGSSSKYNTSWDFLTHLRDVGRSAAQGWLEANFDRIGEATTVDMEKWFL